MGFSMSNFVQVVQAVDALLSSGSVITEDLWESVTTQLPEHYTLTSLAEEASALDQSGQLNEVKARLIALGLFIAQNDGLRREEGEDTAPQRLCDAVAAVIAPRRVPKEEDDENTTYEETIRRSYELGPHGLKIISECVQRYTVKLSEDSLLTVISFLPSFSSSSPAACEHPGDPRQSTIYPWSNDEAARLSLEIFLHQREASYFEEDDLIVETALKGYLRPMFSKSRPKTVTQSGRKAEFIDDHDPHRSLEDENSDVKPWKYTDHRALAVFAWAVGRAKEELMSRQWPLFIPVLLTLVDDGSTRVRTRGLVILNTFLLKFPNNTLRDTGLASVFEDAVLPTLHFLPSLTPEQDSIQLLGPAYTDLLTLARKIDAKAASGMPKGVPRTKFDLLDKILRDGIFSAYFHAKEHIRIVEVLCLQMSDIIQEMGVHAVKHLKDLIPMQSEILTNPFAPLAPDTLRAALKSLHAVLTNCWPRLSTPAYQDELIKTLAICFLNVHDEGKVDLADVKATLIKTAAVFLNASTPGMADKGGNNLQEKVKPLIVQEPLLADLFKQILEH